MPLVTLSKLRVVERLPGWRGRFFHSEHMTFVHYDFEAGALIHEHSHGEEEVYQVLEGRLEITIGDETCLAEPGLAAIVPANASHSVRALSDGKVMIVDSPALPHLG